MAATLTISPSTVTPGATFTASGTAQRKGGASASCRILVENVVKSTFSVGQSGKYSRQIGAPTGADRTVQVLFQQLQGTGQWATTAPARTLTIQGSVPAPQPTIPTVPGPLIGEAGNTTVALFWSAPSSNGGSALTGYIVYKNGAEITTTAAGTTTYTAGGLVNGTDYQFSVAAKNVIGMGPQTSPPITVRPVAPADTTQPVVSNLAHSSVTQTSAVISWTLNELATGRVRYGFSPTALTLLTAHETSFLPAHVQNISGLTANTPYYYQAFGVDAADNPYTSATQPFTTAATAPTGGFLYGMGVYLQTKSNQQIGGASLAKMSIRFLAGQSSAIAQVALNQRGGSGYSLGTGGLQRWEIKADASGLPSGTAIGSVQFSPGNFVGERKEHHPLVTSVLVAGQYYHIVASNPDAAAASNWLSLNNVRDWLAGTQQTDPAPAIPHTVLYNDTGSWSVIHGEAPVFDVLYANGQHDGNMYFAITHISLNPHLVSGSTSMVRERFIKSGGSLAVNAIKLKVRRNFGTSPLIVRLENGDGSLVESVSVPSASVTLVADPQEATSGSAQAEVVATFATARTLVNGQTYNVRLSTASGTQYSVDALRWRDDDMAAWDGWRFRDGAGSSGGGGQKTTDGGGTWVDLYLYDPHDIPFYFA